MESCVPGPGAGTLGSSINVSRLGESGTVLYIE